MEAYRKGLINQSTLESLLSDVDARLFRLESQEA